MRFSIIIQVDLSANILTELPETFGQLRNLKVFFFTAAPSIFFCKQNMKFFCRKFNMVLFNQVCNKNYVTYKNYVTLENIIDPIS